MLQFQLRKTFFVPQTEDEAREARRTLAKQLFQLAYHGKISPEFAGSLEISERNYIYELLSEQIKDEKKAHEAQESKIKSQSAKARSTRGRR